MLDKDIQTYNEGAPNRRGLTNPMKPMHDCICLSASRVD